MEPIEKIIEESKWAKFVNSRLIKNPILGYVTLEDEQDAIRCGAIVNEYGVWKVPVVEIEAQKDGSNFKKGDNIKIVSFKYRDWVARYKSRLYINTKEDIPF